MCARACVLACNRARAHGVRDTARVKPSALRVCASACLRVCVCLWLRVPLECPWSTPGVPLEYP